MTVLARVVFAVLVAATFGAFFVAQRLKNEPTNIQQDRGPRVFSPNRDGRFDRAYVSFKLAKADRVRVEVLDAAGDPVAMIGDRDVPSYKTTRFSWDGRDADGRMVPDGRYRYRLTLRREGRSASLSWSFAKDIVPPRPRVLSIGGEGAPEIVPDPAGKPVVVRLEAYGDKVKVRLFKTSPGRLREVLPAQAPQQPGRWEWDGKVRGRSASAGTYVVQVESRDKAGNIGVSTPLRTAGRRTLVGHAGITVRPLAVRTDPLPAIAGNRTEVLVDARGKPWTASLRRVGGPPGSIRRYRGTRTRLGFTLPKGDSGLYVLAVRTATIQRRIPLLVQGIAHRPVLVVMPLLTWQGRNPVDDDGDGLPNVLDRGVSARVDRPFAGDGLPVGLAEHEAPLLAFLDREHHRYDLTTDLALATGTGPDLADYAGILLPGDTRWLPTALGKRLRAFVRDGGALASFGTGSLRREVRLTSGGRLADPTTATASDLFGARIGAIVPRPTTLTGVQDDIGLFRGGTGEFTELGAYEPTTGVGDGARVVAAASDGEPGAAGGTEAAGQSVIVAARFGRGLVIRPGLADIARPLRASPNTQALVERTWSLLAR